MNTVKDSLLVLEHYPDTEIYVFYMDIRAFGKGFEDLLSGPRKTGYIMYVAFMVRFTEDPVTKNLCLKVENTRFPAWKSITWIWSYWSVGFEPRSELKQLTNILNLSQTSDGFLMEALPSSDL
jgi:heterodisulfide reductase subunit A